MLLPSGESWGAVRSGFPNSSARGMSRGSSAWREAAERKEAERTRAARLIPSKIPAGTNSCHRFAVCLSFMLPMQLESLDLNLLLAFDALVSERNVTRAAEKMGLSHPAMSNALARLRQWLGDPLFERVGGAMQPTARARQLIAPVGEAIATLRQAFEAQPAFCPEE